MSTTLHRAVKRGLSLDAALKEFGRPAVGLFYAPGVCAFGQVNKDGTVTFPEGVPQSILEGVYEARVFDRAAELRWWNDPVELKHRAAIVSEDPVSLSGWKDNHPLAVIGMCCQAYLLWGEATGASEGLPQGWTRLTTARIGKLDVPYIGGKRFVLKAIEYLTEHADGNAAVADERLVGLEPLSEEAST